MSDIYYVYHKVTKQFAGSGVTRIENDNFNSTKIKVPKEFNGRAIFSPQKNCWYEDIDSGEYSAD